MHKDLDKRGLILMRTIILIGRAVEAAKKMRKYIYQK